MSMATPMAPTAKAMNISDCPIALGGVPNFPMNDIATAAMSNKPKDAAAIPMSRNVIAFIISSAPAMNSSATDNSFTGPTKSTSFNFLSSLAIGMRNFVNRNMPSRAGAMNGSMSVPYSTKPNIALPMRLNACAATNAFLGSSIVMSSLLKSFFTKVMNLSCALLPATMLNFISPPDMAPMLVPMVLITADMDSYILDMADGFFRSPPIVSEPTSSFIKFVNLVVGAGMNFISPSARPGSEVDISFRPAANMENCPAAVACVVSGFALLFSSFISLASFLACPLKYSVMDTSAVSCF